MKRNVLLLSMLSFMICSFTPSVDLKWYTWDEGYELAKKENKTMMVFVHASWCHQCRRLDEKVFNNEDIKPLINEGFIPVKFDIEANEDYRMGKKILAGREILSAISKEPVRGIPTTIFWQPDGKKVKPVVGLKDPDEMKDILAKNHN